MNVFKKLVTQKKLTTIGIVNQNIFVNEQKMEETVMTLTIGIECISNRFVVASKERDFKMFCAKDRN